MVFSFVTKTKIVLDLRTEVGTNSVKWPDDEIVMTAPKLYGAIFQRGES